MGAVRRVLIVGGGIGGMTSAVALKRQGIDAEIVELNPAWAVYGVGIIQPSNQMRALRDLGLGEACLRAGQGYLGWRLHDAQGQMFAEVPTHNVAGPGYPQAHGITRTALHKLLTEAVLQQGTRVRLGVTVENWSETPEGLHVRFSDGSEDRYDLLIGADGVYSKVRSLLFGGHLKPHYTGQGAWRHNFQRPRDMEWGAMFYGKNSKAGLVPLSEDLMYMFVLTGEPEGHRMSQDRLHALMRERLTEYGGIIARLREQITDPAEVVYRPLEVFMAPKPWHKGRVVLMGDAAHAGTPHLGQGASMAIEDSAVLAECLNGAEDLDAALKAFTQRRFHRADLVYQTSLKLGQWELADWAGASDPQADHNGLFARTMAALNEPI